MQAAATPEATFPGMDTAIRWVGGLGFESAGMGGAMIHMDQPADEGGTGHGFKPMELFLDAIGVCLGTTIVKIMEKQRLNVQAYAIDVHGDRTAEMPHPYTHVVVTHTFRGPGLNQASLERVVALVEEKYFSVAAILPRGFIENVVRIEESPVAEHVAVGSTS
jgi:putative redox protein